MNHVILIGRLARDPEVRYGDNSKPVARMTIAIDRGKDKDGNDLGADFPSIVAFGKTAENIEKYLVKGRLVAVEGSIRTGSYEKDGKKVYTTDVYATRVQFLEKADSSSSSQQTNSDGFMNVPQGIDDELPFE